MLFQVLDGNRNLGIVVTSLRFRCLGCVDVVAVLIIQNLDRVSRLVCQLCGVDRFRRSRSNREGAIFLYLNSQTRFQERCVGADRESAARNSNLRSNRMCAGFSRVILPCVIPGDDLHIACDFGVAGNIQIDCLVIVIANIINGNGAHAFPVDLTSSNFNVAGVSVLLIVRSVGTTPNINRITDPSRTTIIPILGNGVLLLSGRHTIDLTARDLDLAHTSRDAAFDHTARNIQCSLARHINSLTLGRGQSTVGDNKVHITFRVVAAQASVLAGNRTTTDRCSTALKDRNTILSAFDTTTFQYERTTVQLNRCAVICVCATNFTCFIDRRILYDQLCIVSD